MPKYSLSILALSLGLTIIFLSVMPSSLPPVNVTVFGEDKIAHFLAYYIFSTCLGLAFNLDWKVKRTRLVVIIVSFSFGMVLELIQEYLLPHRTFEVFDLLANSIGICAFVFSGKTIEKIVVKSGIFIN
ncbi:VanZ family protein [Flavobacteriaceae bacterium]|nr:VanZ family protein [Flavobacteriaceae bacterium]